MAHFNPEKPILLTCDASPYGISAVLSQREAGKYDRPICCASRTLSVGEKRYAHHNKEGLSVVFGIREFYQYLYGNELTIQTDSTTLLRIFHPDKSIPEISTARLQRWAIFLSVFKYNIKHCTAVSSRLARLLFLPEGLGARCSSCLITLRALLIFVSYRDSSSSR